MTIEATEVPNSTLTKVELVEVDDAGKEHRVGIMVPTRYWQESEARQTVLGLLRVGIEESLGSAVKNFENKDLWY